jgi:hypothetical protein
MGVNAETAAPFQSQADAYQQQRGQAMLDDKSQTQELLKQALERDYQAAQKKQGGGGFFSKLGGILKVAAPIAASFIPGVGPMAAMAIGAAGNAAGTKMQGGSWGQALGGAALGAGMSAATGGLGKVFQKPPVVLNNKLSSAAVPQNYRLPRGTFNG